MCYLSDKRSKIVMFEIFWEDFFGKLDVVVDQDTRPIAGPAKNLWLLPALPELDLIRIFFGNGNYLKYTEEYLNEFSDFIFLFFRLL